MTEKVAVVMETRLVTKAGHTGTVGEGGWGEKKREMCVNKHKHAREREGRKERKV